MGTTLGEITGGGGGCVGAEREGWSGINGSLSISIFIMHQRASVCPCTCGPVGKSMEDGDIDH